VKGGIEENTLTLSARASWYMWTSLVESGWKFCVGEGGEVEGGDWPGVT